ncbi:hypothetical protein EVAR_65762_1 [Eumeta japonica]|uniref:Uncharacterized protein n=1 Tax=Eumeta variegata TaxID=151549 RepID=A0A4C1ZT02_EUMVA|nr:hypothetical protein EVAR_65762_1 [Eumeta japonica]
MHSPWVSITGSGRSRKASPMALIAAVKRQSSPKSLKSTLDTVQASLSELFLSLTFRGISRTAPCRAPAAPCAGGGGTLRFLHDQFRDINQFCDR